MNKLSVETNEYILDICNWACKSSLLADARYVKWENFIFLFGMIIDL